MGAFSTQEFVPSEYGSQMLAQNGILNSGNVGIQGSDNIANVYLANLNNAAQIGINKENNLFNAQQAQLQREWSAQQAELARQWNSEQEVMKRRSDAGLNTAMVGDGAGASSSASSPASGGSAATANGTPQLVTPQVHPLNSDQLVSGILNSATDVMEKLSKIPQNVEGYNTARASTANLLASAEHERTLSDYQKILNEYTPEKVTADIDLMRANIDKTKTSALHERVLAQRNMMDTKAVLSDMYYKYVDRKLAERGSNIDAEQLKNDWYEIGLKLEQDSQKAVNLMRSTAVGLAFNTWQNSNSSDLTEYASMSHSISNGNNFHAGIGGKGQKDSGEENVLETLTKASKKNGRQFRELTNSTLGKSILGNIDINGGISNGKSYFDSEFAQSTNNTSGFRNLFNTEAYRRAVANIAFSKIIQDPKSTFKERAAALDGIYQIRITWNDFKDEVLKNVNEMTDPDFAPLFQQLQQTP